MNMNLYAKTTLAILGIAGVSYMQGETQGNCIQHEVSQSAVAHVRSGLLRSEHDLVLLFPHTVADIQERTDEALADAYARLAAIIAVPNDERTYDNTMRAFDQLCGFSSLSIFRKIAELVSMVYSDAAIRDTAREASKKMTAFFVDEISNNEALYNAIKAYAATAQEPLSDEQRYYITETISTFKRGGLELPADKRAIIAGIKKELADLNIAFNKNIAADNKTVVVAKEGLAGLTDDFIAGLKQTEDGHYVLTTDYPTAFGVMQDCVVEKTREELCRIFDNRGYPANEGVLKAIIAKRDALAHELGFESYAHLDLDDQMVKHPSKAETFLDELVKRSTIKENAEFKELTAELPESVTLTADGKLKPWDSAYVTTQYKKKQFNLDERIVAEYFSMEHTVQRLLNIYEQFMGLSFKVKSAENLWHEDVKLIEAYDASTHKLLGYLLLDLHPRPNKYTHACHGNIVPSVRFSNGSEPFMVSIVIANFPKSTVTKPSLLKREDVRVFFHEFGHALHGLLGRTPTASYSGTRVKTDFVEMPSIMLEEWLWERDVLKQVSAHYVTGEPLSDALIESILASKHCNTGSFVQRQASLALISLNYYKAGAHKDVDAIMRDLSLRTRPNVAYDDETHKYASFGHLTGYGAKYYSYMWAKVFALDLFDTIKKHGLSPEIGKKYVDEVLSKGGSKDPMDLLVAFLGREPQQDAFFKDLGL